MNQKESALETDSSVFVFPIIARSRGQLGTPLDGRYGAMIPSELRSAIARLILRLNLEGVDYIIGIPEGGLIPAYEFASATKIKLILASHSQPDGLDSIRFIEPHSTSDNRIKFIYGLSPGDKVVVVEDEVTTGATLLNCVRALREAGVLCEDVASIYCADDASIFQRLATANIRLHHLWNFSKKTANALVQDNG